MQQLKLLPTDTCNELIAIGRACAVVGYRPNVSSATIFEIAATSPSLLPALIEARGALHAAAEDAFNDPLLIEFTGLIAWLPGADLDWHCDNDRPYLAQRSYAAVCHLSSQGTAFTGGDFAYRDNENDPVVKTFHPEAGSALIYPANLPHRVSEVVSGERWVLTMWFTDRPHNNEDTALLASCMGAGVPESMYMVPPNARDIRLCRLGVLGVDVVSWGAVYNVVKRRGEEVIGTFDSFLEALLSVFLGSINCGISFPCCSRHTNKGTVDCENVNNTCLLQKLGSGKEYLQSGRTVFESSFKHWKKMNAIY